MLARRLAAPLAAAVLLVPLSCARGKKDEAVNPHEIRGESTVAHRAPPAGATPVRGGQAVLTLLADVDSFNPFVSSSAEASEIHDLLLPRLLDEQPNYDKGPPDFTPRIAESWTAGEDGLSWKFKLRECTWSDGTPITAEDVRFSWQAAIDPQVAFVSASHVDSIKDVEIHGPREFTVRYHQKHPYQVMEINDVQVLPKHVFGKVPFEQWQGHGSWEAEARVSGGPWVLASYKPNQEIVLGRNPRYWEAGKPYLDRLVIRIFADSTTLSLNVQSGDVDFMRGVKPAEAKKFLGIDHLRLYTYTTRAEEHIGWNNRRWPFTDPRVRRAMTHAIDREDLVESLWYGWAEVAAPAIIRSLWASNRALEPLEYDPDKAEALLREAGFRRNAQGIQEKDGKPLRFTLSTNVENTLRVQACTYIQADLKDVGVVVDIRPIEFNLQSEQLKKHEFDAFLGGMYEATKVDLKAMWHSTSADGQFNYVAYSNPRVDEIIDVARHMMDFREAKPLWDELQQILHDEQPFTWVCEPRGIVAVHRKMQNVRVTSLRVWDNVHEWWIDESR